MMSKFKSILKEVLIGAAILIVLTNIISYLRQPELSFKSFPKIEVKLLDGSAYTFKKNKPLVLHFWATWCPTCKLEVSNIEFLSKDHEVLTIAVNSGDDASIKNYLNQKDLHFKVINDKESALAQEFNVEAYPTTFIFDRKGELRFTEVGYTSTAGLLARLKLIE